jgi:hypothetical protein
MYYFALKTCCACGLGLCPRTKGFALGTCCTRGLMLRPWDLLHLWPWGLPLGLAALVALGSALGTRCAHGVLLVALGFAHGTRCTRSMAEPCFFCSAYGRTGWGDSSVDSITAVLVASGFALGPRVLPSGLAALVALGFPLGICWARGLVLCPWDSLHLWHGRTPFFCSAYGRTGGGG